LKKKNVAIRPKMAGTSVRAIHIGLPGFWFKA
jgi:hypothetical protein